jgi:GTP-binding protein Era
MQRAAAEAAEGCDLALVLVDGTRGWEAAHDALAARLTVPWLAVRTKIDLAGARKGPWPPPEAAGAAGVLEVSAATGEGVEALLREIVARLPEGPAFHAPDDLTDRPLRFLAAELVREAAFGLLQEELPYSIAVEVEEFDEKTRPDLVRIRANLLVSRASQKRIVIGSGGEMIREIGTRARQEIERLIERRVHLELWVKVEPGWAKRRQRVEGLGYV